MAKENIDSRGSLTGLLAGISSFLIWGLSVILWKLLSGVPAFESLMHRMVWSFILLIVLVILTGRWGEFKETLTNIKTISVLVVTTIIITLNWYVFIWAINTNQILQASLGYYINPLVNVLLGMVILKERLRPYQITAVILATIGVFYLTLKYGQFPWIALLLAFSFGFYGLIRKMASINPISGLTVETLILSIPASLYLGYIASKGNGAFLNVSLKTDIFLICTALVTALPLLLFNIGAKLLRFSTIGFIQYIAPTCTFLLAVFVYGEPLSNEQLIAFIFIWTALIVYTIDSYRYYKELESSDTIDK